MEWEELDVDDSDLFASLRPCKRQNQSRNNPEVTANFAVSISPSQQIPISEHRFPSPRSQALVSHSPHSSAFSNPNRSSPRTIPGPAAKVQAAMYRQSQNIINSLSGDKPNSIQQQYIQSAVENEYIDVDDDFFLDPWLCAVDFVRSKGMVGGGCIGTPICSIKEIPIDSKVDQVVAVINSYSPNCLGDLMVTLKDLTGSIGASIHHKVLDVEDFRKGICAGSVLVLQEVAVFSPSHGVHYLNITRRNVLKVFGKDATLLINEKKAESESMVDERNVAPGATTNKESILTRLTNPYRSC